MPLKKNEIENFKKRLIDLRAQYLNQFEHIKNEVKELDDSKGYSQHQADEGTDDFGKTISLEISNKEIHIIKQIDRALEKIEQGHYGICDISGEEIPKARLEAIPFANMTVEMQEKEEKEEKEEI